jgi:hypothetical protein
LHPRFDDSVVTCDAAKEGGGGFEARCMLGLLQSANNPLDPRERVRQEASGAIKVSVF